MQVLCVATTKDTADVECPHCHQCFAVYYSRYNRAECAAALEEVRAALLQHHAADPQRDGHHADAFNVPAWNGPAYASGAALLSGAPVPRTTQPIPFKVPAAPQQRRVS